MHIPPTVSKPLYYVCNNVLHLDLSKTAPDYIITPLRNSALHGMTFISLYAHTDSFLQQIINFRINYLQVLFLELDKYALDI